jgi:hypothetical protein
MDEMRTVHKILARKLKVKGPLGREDVNEWILSKGILKKYVVTMGTSSRIRPLLGSCVRSNKP